MVARQWSLSGLSAELGIDRRRMGKIVASLTPCGVGKSRESLYRMADVIDALQQSASAAGSPGDLADAELRKAAAEAELKELRLARERGELIAVDDLARLVEAEYVAVRSRLLAIPSKLAPEIAQIDNPTEVQALIAAEIHEALDELGRDEIDAAGLETDNESDRGDEECEGEAEAREASVTSPAASKRVAVGRRRKATQS